MFGGIDKEKFVTLVTLAIMSQTRDTKNPNILPGPSYFVFGYVYGFLSRSFELWPKPILKSDEEFEYSFEVIAPLILLNFFDTNTMKHILECNESEEKYNYTIEKYPNYKEGIQIGADDAHLAFIRGRTPTELKNGFLLPHQDKLIERGMYKDQVINRDRESFNLINDTSTRGEDIFKKYQQQTAKEIEAYYDETEEHMKKDFKLSNTNENEEEDIDKDLMNIFEDETNKNKEDTIVSLDILFLKAIRDNQCKRNVNLKTAKNIFGLPHWRRQEKKLNAFDINEISSLLGGLHWEEVGDSLAKLVRLEYVSSVKWEDTANNDENYLTYINENGLKFLKEIGE